jgi:CRP-like cAMP-binding protein
MCAGVQTGTGAAPRVPVNDGYRVNAVTTNPPSPAGNALLKALPRADLRRVLADCESIGVVPAQVLQSPGERLPFIYFPVSCVVSMLLPSVDSAGFEVGVVGSEGMVGLASALDAGASAERAIVLTGGRILRMRSALARLELGRGGALRRGIDGYMAVRLGQLAQASVCANFHPLVARLARQLLVLQERVRSNTISATQECLALRLGVRRVGVTTAARALQRRRLIQYRRGTITILDKRGLTSAACSCPLPAR